MKRKILIVEDDEMIRDNLKELLELENFEVLQAAHGKLALDLLEQIADQPKQEISLPSVILLDLNMPVMSGRDFLAEVRSRAQPYSSIPVIVMTAIPEATDLGTAGFMRKPLDFSELLVGIQRVILK